MTTSTSQIHDRVRISIVASIWTIIILAIPLWWKTTEVHRAPLPVDRIKAWRDSRVDTSSSSSTLPASTKSTIATRIQQNLELLFKVSQDAPGSRVGLGFKIVVGNGKDGDVDVETDMIGRYGVNVKCGATIEGGQEQEIIVREYRTMDLLVKSKCVEDDVVQFATAAIAGLFADENREFKKMAWNTGGVDNTDHDSMRKLKFSPEYQLTFSLLNADPENILVDWDIREGIDEYVRPFLNAVSLLHRFDVSSQIQAYASLPIQPERSVDPEGNTQFYFLRPSHLPHFINSAEWNLGGSVVSTSPPINLIMYVPPKSQSPLHVVTSQGYTLHTNGFLIPQWGGIVISNPDRERDSLTYSVAALKPVMEVFLAQLRGLLGVKEVKLSGGDAIVPSTKITYIPSKIGITGWELDRLLRTSTINNMASAASTLNSLSTLISSMENMVVLDHIAKGVSESLDSLDSDKASINGGGGDGAGGLMNAVRESRKSIQFAESAFFDPTMVSLLYFPDEHKYAVYMPLFTPITVPLVIALVKEIRQLIKKPKKDGKVKSE
ncbi:hypothetical protein HDU76_009148 [Blyttiomyces sp. JEL0837]|nr:hypothetical protein HDU76_009148 [Blyttiomyces sp. JEL0837]